MTPDQYADLSEAERQARAEAHQSLIDAWHQYLATLPPAERWARLA